jgi:hypothetical protein
VYFEVGADPKREFAARAAAAAPPAPVQDTFGDVFLVENEQKKRRMTPAHKTIR